ncbi:MAG: sugar phosphate isomerase/epimerase [Candidatus Aenigmarchaeota archaeon]|nr:sugar phosphate isomerase/epimerase [Candidatus Aenigmarchaeota archaeon]
MVETDRNASKMRFNQPGLPKFGTTTNPSLDLMQEIREIAALNFDFVEIGIEEPEGSPKIIANRAGKINRIIKKHRMFALGHAAWWIDLGSPHEIVRDAWLEECKKVIDAGKRINIEKITFHAHSQSMMLSDRGTLKEVISNYIENMKKLVDYAGDSMVVMLENTTEMSSIKDFQKIISKVDGLAVNLDIGHAFIGGGMKSISNHIKKFGKRIQHIHMHDNHGKMDEHLPVGIASIDFRRTVKELKKIKYGKTISMEIFVPERVITRISEEIIKEFWE